MITNTSATLSPEGHGRSARLVSIKGVRDAGQVLSATLWPEATEPSGFAPSTQDRILLLIIKLIELVAG